MLNSMTIEQVKVLKKALQLAIAYSYSNEDSTLTDSDLDTILQLQIAIETKLYSLQEGR